MSVRAVHMIREYRVSFRIFGKGGANVGSEEGGHAARLRGP